MRWYSIIIIISIQGRIHDLYVRFAVVIAR